MSRQWQTEPSLYFTSDSANLDYDCMKHTEIVSNTLFQSVEISGRGKYL